MKYCRFQHNGRAEYGLVETVGGQDKITRLLLKPPACGEDLEDLPTKAVAHVAFAEAPLLVPVQPSKIVCVGRNYREHAAELGNEVPVEPLLFLKPPSSVIGPEVTIMRPKISARVDHEAELGVVIAKRC